MDIILVYSSSSDVSPSLGEITDQPFFSHMFVLGAKSEYLYVGQKAGPEGTNIMLKLQCNKKCLSALCYTSSITCGFVVSGFPVSGKV